MTDIKVGDEVRVFYSDGRERRNRPDDGYPGEVVKVGRTLATIRYQGHEAQFRLDTGRLNDRYGNTASFLTPAQVEANRRQDAALALLKEAGFEVRLGRHPDSALVEKLAAAVLDWTAEQTGRTSMTTTTDPFAGIPNSDDEYTGTELETPQERERRNAAASKEG